MAHNHTTTLTKFAATLATNAMLMISTAPAVQAKEKTLIIDDVNGRMTACAIEGGAFSETKTTFSCTNSKGETTTCDKQGDYDTACGTEVAESTGRGNGHKSGLSVGVPPAHFTMGRSQTNGLKPRPGKYIMQYSMQN